MLNMADVHLEVRVPGPPGALDRVFTWSIPTESMDPRPFLTPDSLVLTSGITLNVTDSRVWDAYVERLSFVSIAALVFALGPAHKEVPKELAAACERYGLPLLIVPADLPFALVQRDIQDRITAERYDMIRRGSELAQECTELVARGGTLQDMLQLIASVTDRRVVLEDRTGTELLRAGGPGPISGRSEFTLPGLDAGSFRLVIEAPMNAPLIASFVRPATAVVAMHLNTTLGSTATTFSRHAGQLVDAIFSRESIPTDELLAMTREAELDPYRPIGVVMIEVDTQYSVTYLRTVSWRVRTRLATEFRRLRFVDDPAISTLLVQGNDLDGEHLLQAVKQAVGSFSNISCRVDVVENSAELGIALRHIRRALGTASVQLSPAMDFDAVVDTLRHPGTESMARRMLAPLQGEKRRPLRDTLEAYLRLSGAKSEICETLFIHRNTLTHRLNEIEKLLGGIDLQDGQVRATLMLAIRLVPE
jgi:purine catabolism regulator